MNIAILGFGNIGHQTAVLSAVAGNNVSVFYSQRLTQIISDDFYKNIQILDDNKNCVHSAKILFSQNAQKIFANADLIFITRPAFLSNATAKFLENNLPTNFDAKPLKICLLPGNNGAEFAFKNLIQSRKNIELFALQRVPSVSRIIENLHSVQCRGYRKQLQIANLKSQNNNPENQKIIENIFQIPTTILPHFLNISLAPSNNILHTSRLFCIFQNFTRQKSYAKLPLFYENWDDQSSQILLQMDDELTKIIRKLQNLNLPLQINPLRKHYGDLTETKIVQNPSQLTHKLQSIISLQGLTTPSIKITENKFIPNFTSRYFCDDFAFGVKFLIQIANLLSLNADFKASNKVFSWYKNLHLQQNEFDFANYKINNLQDFLDYYQ